MTTRLNKSEVANTEVQLLGVLNNIVRFTQLPVRSREKWVKFWNAQFPRELIASTDYLESMGYRPHTIVDKVTVSLKHNGRKITMPVALQFLEQDTTKKFIFGTTELFTALEKPGVFIFTPTDFTNFFGADDGESIVEHMVQTAELQAEIDNAIVVIHEILHMAKTAGQIKRMVPDLLQYLSQGLREAYEQQKRASSLPFEWAPYPKDRVNKMILTISKGYLLAGMTKPGQEQFSCSAIEILPWGLHA